MVGTKCICNILFLSAPGSRMDGMAFCPFRNMNAELKNAGISHSGHSHSRIVNKKTRSNTPFTLTLKHVLMLFN